MKFLYLFMEYLVLCSAGPWFCTGHLRFLCSPHFMTKHAFISLLTWQQIFPAVWQTALSGFKRAFLHSRNSLKMEFLCNFFLEGSAFWGTRAKSKKGRGQITGVVFCLVFFFNCLAWGVFWVCLFVWLLWGFYVVIFFQETTPCTLVPPPLQTRTIS